MNRHRSLHSHFFTSLKQVEKRLKLDNLSQPPPPPETGNISIGSQSSPMYLYVDHNHSNFDNLNSNLDNSETPVEFLSSSVDFPQTHENLLQESYRNGAKVDSSSILADENETNLLDSHLPHRVSTRGKGNSHFCRKESLKTDALIVKGVENDADDNSETPAEFLTNSVEFPQTHENPPLKSYKNDSRIEENNLDEIELLFELLELSDIKRGGSKSDQVEIIGTCSSCRCEGGFYDKIVGMKGPKCGKEMERLDGWIKHFGDEKIEPYRLAHLLLGKATCIKGDDRDDGGFEMAEFPSTVEEFLLLDPPIKLNEGAKSDGG